MSTNQTKYTINYAINNVTVLKLVEIKIKDGIAVLPQDKPVHLFILIVMKYLQMIFTLDQDVK